MNKSIDLSLIAYTCENTFSQEIFEELINKILSMVNYPIVPLMHCFDHFIEQLIRQGVLDAFNIIVSTKKYFLRKISVSLPEYDIGALYFRSRGISHRGAIIPGPIYFAKRIYDGETLFIDKPEETIDTIGYIVSRIIMSLSSLGYNNIVIVEPELHELFLERKRVWNLSQLQRLYNQIISWSDAEMYGLVICDKIEPTVLGALFHTKIDYIAFNPFVYTVQEINTITSHLTTSTSQLALLAIDPSMAYNINDLVKYIRPIVNKTLMILNTCNTWSKLFENNYIDTLYKHGLKFQRLLFKLLK